MPSGLAPSRRRQHGTVVSRASRCANEQVWSGAHPDAIRRAFIDYQHASEARRQLAVDVGELSQQLIEVLCASGFTEQAARSADVHELAATGVMLGAWERSR